jgi:poly(A)-specific ribonuclease
VSLEDLADDEERLFASQLIDSVSAWLASGAPTLEVPRVGPGYARLQEQILAGGPFRMPPGVEAPGFVVDYAAGDGSGSGGGDGGGPPGSGMALLLRRAAPGAAAAAAAARDAALAAGANDAAGFSLVFEAMRGCGKPAVAHNLRYDLAFALQQFVGPLPPAWRGFKEMAGAREGGGCCALGASAQQGGLCDAKWSPAAHPQSTHPAHAPSHCKPTPPKYPTAPNPPRQPTPTPSPLPLLSASL